MLLRDGRAAAGCAALLCTLALPLVALAEVPTAAVAAPAEVAEPVREAVPAGEVPGSATPSSSGQPSSALAHAELARWADRLTGVDVKGREESVAAIGRASPRLLQAVAQRLAELKRAGNRAGLAAALRGVHPEASGAARPLNAASARELDTLGALMKAARPSDTGWRDAVLAVGLCRVLGHVGTLSATRELVGAYEAFGDTLRGPVERELKELGERAVAVLIETRRGPHKGLRSWASRLLDTLGKTVPGEAVQTSDHQVLADVLRAYGRTKDVDAARIVVSFANSDRAQVREAAREAVTALGETAIWQLRESYENATGKKPPDAWGWQRLQGELFASYDRSRLVGAATLMDEGLAAARAGHLAEMASAFDRALSRAPDFERAREMVPGYVAYAQSLVASDPARAVIALRRAAHLDPTGPHANEARARVAYLEAQILAERGVVDRSGFERATQLDRANVEFKRALAQIDGGTFVAPRRPYARYARYACASLLLLMAAAGVIISFYGRRAFAAFLHRHTAAR